jgi:hypothetical protein
LNIKRVPPVAVSNSVQYRGSAMASTGCPKGGSLGTGGRSCARAHASFWIKHCKLFHSSNTLGCRPDRGAARAPGFRWQWLAERTAALVLLHNPAEVVRVVILDDLYGAHHVAEVRLHGLRVRSLRQDGQRRGRALRAWSANKWRCSDDASTWPPFGAVFFARPPTSRALESNFIGPCALCTLCWTGP